MVSHARASRAPLRKRNWVTSDKAAASQCRKGLVASLPSLTRMAFNRLSPKMLVHVAGLGTTSAYPTRKAQPPAGTTHVVLPAQPLLQHVWNSIPPPRSSAFCSGRFYTTLADIGLAVDRHTHLGVERKVIRFPVSGWRFTRGLRSNVLHALALPRKRKQVRSGAPTEGSYVCTCTCGFTRRVLLG